MEPAGSALNPVGRASSKQGELQSYESLGAGGESFRASREGLRATCTCDDSQRYWELYRLRPSTMGAYLTTALNADPNAVKYCINTAKMAYIADNPIFLGMF